MATADAGPGHDTTSGEDERSTPGRWLGWALLAATLAGAAAMVWFDDTWRPFGVVAGMSCTDGAQRFSNVSGRITCTRDLAASWPLGLLVVAGATLGLVVLRRRGGATMPAVIAAASSYAFALAWILGHLGGTQSVTENVVVVTGRPRRGTPRRRPTTAASHWATAAAEEAEAVAAFDQLADDLERLGAPTDLITRARRAALEERGHAHTCAALAGTATPPVPPVPTPRRRPRRLDLVDLAVTSYRDGALNEGGEAARLTAAAHAATDPRIAAACRRLALDERSHAELAWDTIAWTRTTGGPGIDLALRHAGRHLRSTPRPHLLGDPLTPGQTAAAHTAAAGAARRRLTTTLTQPR